ncbi:hypothetical protein ACJMK2_016193 [Sinanodonta woodiana]|uniref:Uncharacterized protein n=1 Tax=Sinanodonta woodiana TaxID=1069815 RepID=A0ABD3USU5_SINWO
MSPVRTYLLAVFTALLDHVVSEICGDKGYNTHSCMAGCCGPSYSQYCCDSSLDAGTIGGIVVGSVIGLAFLLTTLIVCCCCLRRKAPGARTLQPHTVPWFTTGTATSSTVANSTQMTMTQMTLEMCPPPYEEYQRYGNSNPSSNLVQITKQYDAPPPSYEQAIKNYEIQNKDGC